MEASEGEHRSIVDIVLEERLFLKVLVNLGYVIRFYIRIYASSFYIRIGSTRFEMNIRSKARV